MSSSDPPRGPLGDGPLGDDEIRRALASRMEQGPGEHLDSDLLWGLAAGELPPTEAVACIDHISTCPACAEDLRLTREIQEEAHSEEFTVHRAPALEVPRARIPEASPDGAKAPGRARDRHGTRRGRRKGWPLLAAAASMAIATGLFWVISQDQEGPTPGPGGEAPFREAPQRETPGPETPLDSRLEDGVAQPRNSLRLEWTPVAGARYDVVLMDEGLEIVAEGRFLEQPNYPVSPDALAKTPSGDTLIWQVEAILPDGRRLASPAYELTLAEAEPGAE